LGVVVVGYGSGFLLWLVGGSGGVFCLGLVVFGGLLVRVCVGWGWGGFWFGGALGVIPKVWFCWGVFVWGWGTPVGFLGCGGGGFWVLGCFFCWVGLGDFFFWGVWGGLFGSFCGVGVVSMGLGGRFLGVSFCGVGFFLFGGGGVWVFCGRGLGGFFLRGVLFPGVFLCGGVFLVLGRFG